MVDSDEEVEVNDRSKEKVAVKAPRKQYDVTKNNKRKENTRVKDKLKTEKCDSHRIVADLDFTKPCCSKKRGHNNCMQYVHRPLNDIICLVQYDIYFYL